MKTVVPRLAALLAGVGVAALALYGTLLVLFLGVVTGAAPRPLRAGR